MANVREGTVIRDFDPQQLAEEGLAGHGTDHLTPVSEQEAIQGAQQEADENLANRELGTGGKALMGAFSGATAGFGPAALVKGMEHFGDKDAPLARHLMSGASSSDAYKAGMVAGLVGQSVLTGGMLDEAAAAMKLSALLPEATGIMGSIIRPAVSMGVRGSLEGAIMGVGNAAEEAALQNKGLTSEAILSRMGEGALIGGGLGAVFGGVGGAIRGTLDAGGGVVSSALKGGKIARALERIADAEEGMGARGSKTLLKQVGELEGGMPGFMERAEKGLELEGVRLTDTPQQVFTAANKLEGEANKLRLSAARAFDKHAPGSAPAWSSFANRVRDEVVGDAVMMPGGQATATRVMKWLDQVVPTKWTGYAEDVGVDLVGPETTKAVKVPVDYIQPDEVVRKPGTIGYVRDPDTIKNVRVKVGEEPGYTKVKDVKVQVGEQPAHTEVVDNFKASARKGGRFAGDVEVQQIKEHAAKPIKETVQTLEEVPAKAKFEDFQVVERGKQRAVKGMVERVKPGKVSQVFGEVDEVVPGEVTKGKAQLWHEGTPTTFEDWAKGTAMFRDAPGLPPDIAQKVRTIYRDELNRAMELAEAKNPLLKGQSGNYKAMELQAETMGILKDSKIGAFSGKADIKTLAKDNPGIHTAILRMSNATKMTQAVAELKAKVAEGVSGFISARNSVATGSYIRNDKPQKNGDDFSRANFDREVALAQKLVSMDRKEREDYLVKHTGSMALASAMADKADTAAAYIAPKIPASAKVKGAAKLRSVHQSVHPRPDEMKFMRAWGVIKRGPMAVLDDLKTGRVSKESVDTLKNVWPESYQLMVAEFHDQITDMKSRGESMPIAKITQMSIMLDAPADTVVQRTFIGPVQAALNTPDQPARKPTPAATPDGSSEEYATSAEKAMV